jgi:hypothetical protein
MTYDQHGSLNKLFFLKSNQKSYWGTLVPRINVEKACIQQISFYVFLYIHAVVRYVTLFVWVHCYNYLLLTASFSCTLIYAARLLPADILSVRDVIRLQLGYSIALCPCLCALIWLLYQSVLSSCVLPE